MKCPMKPSLANTHNSWRDNTGKRQPYRQANISSAHMGMTRYRASKKPLGDMA